MKIFSKGTGMTVTHFRNFLILGCMKTIFISSSSMQMYIFIALFFVRNHVRYTENQNVSKLFETII